MREPKFYVYEAIGENGEMLYVGKGTGSRIATQRRRFKTTVRVVRRFWNEADAFKFEVEYIAKTQPIFNKNKGGAGGCYGVAAGSNPLRLKGEELSAMRKGTKYYAAWALAQFDLTKHLTHDQIIAIKMYMTRFDFGLESKNQTV